MGKRISEELKNNIVQTCLILKSITKTAKKLNIPISTVQKYVSLNKIKLIKKSDIIPVSIKNQIKDLFNSGNNTTEISNKLLIARITIDRFLISNNLKLPKQSNKTSISCKKCKLWKTENTKEKLVICKNCDLLKRKGCKLKDRYNITLEEYDKMIKEQENKCYICSSLETAKDNKGNIRKLAVDHNHITNKVRRLLCSKCNIGLGSFKDNPELLEKAANYLRKFQ